MGNEVHLEPPSPVRCQGRTSFHRASSAHSEQQPGWGRGFFSPHPIPAAESVLHLAGRFFPPGIDSGNHPGSPTCPPLPCRGSSLGLRRRSQGPRADMDRVVLEARSQSQAFRARRSTSTRPTAASHRVTKPGGLRPSPFRVSCRNKGHAPERPFPGLCSMCRGVPRSPRSPRPPPPSRPVGFSRQEQQAPGFGERSSGPQSVPGRALLLEETLHIEFLGGKHSSPLLLTTNRTLVHPTLTVELYTPAVAAPRLPRRASDSRGTRPKSRGRFLLSPGGSSLRWTRLRCRRKAEERLHGPRHLPPRADSHRFTNTRPALSDLERRGLVTVAPPRRGRTDPWTRISGLLVLQGRGAREPRGRTSFVNRDEHAPYTSLRTDCPRSRPRTGRARYWPRHPALPAKVPSPGVVDPGNRSPAPGWGEAASETFSTELRSSFWPYAVTNRPRCTIESATSPCGEVTA